MKHIFTFIGKISKDITPEKIQAELTLKISAQQAQFNNGTGDNDPNNIEIIEHAYTNAEPNCFLVFAKWKLK